MIGAGGPAHLLSASRAENACMTPAAHVLTSSAIVWSKNDTISSRWADQPPVSPRRKLTAVQKPRLNGLPGPSLAALDPAATLLSP